MRLTPFLVILVASVATLLAPAAADACSPIYSGTSTIAQDDTPECLTVNGTSFHDDGWEFRPITVQNDCDEVASFDCVDDGRECGPIEVAAGEVTELPVPSGTTRVQWTIVDESGLVSFRLNGSWSDCDDRFNCATAPERPGGTRSAPVAFFLSLLGLAAVRRRRG